MSNKDDDLLYVSDWLTVEVSQTGHRIVFRQPDECFADNCGDLLWSDWPALRDAIEAEYVKRTGEKEAKQ